MAIQVPSTRRDRRFSLRDGVGVVEIRGVSAPLLRISIAGIAFRLGEPMAGLTPGSVVPQARIRIGECVLDGDVAIRETHPLDGSATEVGALFIPASRDVEARLMALMAGIGAVGAD